MGMSAAADMFFPGGAKGAVLSSYFNHVSLSSPAAVTPAPSEQFQSMQKA